MSGLFSFCFIFVTVLKRRWKHSSAFLWTEPEVWGVCEKEQIAFYSSVTRSDLFFFLLKYYILEVGAMRKGRGVSFPILILSVQTSLSCFLSPPPATFQGWLSITLTFLFACSVNSQLLYIYLCPTNTFEFVPYS